MTTTDIRARVEAYYTDKVRQHGPTPAGVDWSSAASQALRFDKLLEVCREVEAFSVLDYGCGYAALLGHLRQAGRRCRYLGFDLSADMIDRARALYPDDVSARFTTDPEGLAPVDFTLASGIFNVKLQTARPEWESYVLETLDRIAALSTRGFAFNVLTSYSDADHMRPDLHYADPLALFDHCKRRYSPFVALLHDYPLYEFTILVRR